jgi:hypothetical protein
MMTMMTMTTRRSSEVPKPVRAQLQQPQARYRRLSAMLPTNVNDLADLDPDDLDAKLADIELIATEMQRVSAAEIAILEELAAAARAVETNDEQDSGGCVHRSWNCS